jgi:hypothetical protein
MGKRMTMNKLPIGISDFKEIVTGDYCYVDKTLLIKEILDRGDKVLWIPRPRRFGKTLNLSMLRYFFDCCPEDDLGDLFGEFKIFGAGQEYLDKLGKHPVIFISFRSIKELDWESCWSKIKQLVQAEYLKHDYLLDSDRLKPPEKDYFRRIINLEGERGDVENSLEKLLIFLSRYYDQRGVILVDEYDAPVHAGFTYDYYDEIIHFMRNFLCGGLKDTDSYLEKSIITGIMRLAKESIFSGLNNLAVYTLVAEEFDEFFGFTEGEVKALLEDFQLSDMFGQVRDWYNGYQFGKQIVYNPWSVINFLGSKSKELKPYWINTSDNQMVETLLSDGGRELKEEMELLVKGDSIEKAVEENIVLKDIDVDEDFLWGFLLMGGYLKQTSRKKDDGSGKIFYTLAIPNKEVRTTYAKIIDRYFSTNIEHKKLEIMLKALIGGDIKLFEKMLKKIVLAVFSYHDFSHEPEKVYHALVAGLLIWISNTHEIRSNRESGYGRYDIMVIPKDPRQIGYIIEFKVVDSDDDETVDEALDAALTQINEKRYDTQLIERGIQHIKKMAIAFSGKQLFLKCNG